VLSSLGTGKPSPLPTSQPPEPPVSSSTTKPDTRKPGNGSLGDGNTGAGTKRKAEDQLQRRPKPGNQIPDKKPTVKPSTSTLAKSRPNPTPQSAAKPAPKAGVSTTQKPGAAPSKAPPKNSFADIMAKAKDLQQKTPTSVGMLKHETGPKERLSKTERRKRVMEAREKEKNARSGKKVDPNPKAGGPAAAGKREPEVPSYKGTGRPTQTSKPSQPSQPAYRGTAGLPSRVDPKDRKPQAGQRSKMDDYLGTDEEDEGEYADDYDDYYSESSDMEAGLNDVEQEEATALKSARREDEEEWQAELAAKKEKEDRRKKLDSLASRSK
jgi:hypothetical protein